ncbi:hypothetical protein Ahy_B06g081704 [Arachis hypogaea]|uniref:Iron hydrogenase large subunit C-terminal domain-containing protein n=1 Tax=Arachis hypogaea TaxID=3818 RepID=A0A444YLN1_ARAHY|nr:hypothetical protein Ahy_B06g081704 [Arachis hypogaea]
MTIEFSNIEMKLLCDVCRDIYAREIKFGLVFKKLTRFFNSLGAMVIFDTSSRDFTLIKSCMEFMSRYKQNQLFDYEKNKSSLPTITSACLEKQLWLFVLANISTVKSPQQTI